MEEETKAMKADYSINGLVMWVLIILTVGEFYLGAASGGRAAIFMFAFAFIKGGFILFNYMNVGRAFSGGEDH